MSRSRRPDVKFKRGKICPYCHKGRLERCDVPSHKNCALCKTCGSSNF